MMDIPIYDPSKRLELFAGVIDLADGSFPIDTMSLNFARSGMGQSQQCLLVFDLNGPEEPPLAMPLREFPGFPADFTQFAVDLVKNEVSSRNDVGSRFLISPAVKTVWGRWEYWCKLRLGSRNPLGQHVEYVDWFEVAYGPTLTPTLTERHSLRLGELADKLDLAFAPTADISSVVATIKQIWKLHRALQQL